MFAHPVFDEIKRRKNGQTPQLRLALSVEGGGMRSVVSAGMLKALRDFGIGPECFDAVFGSSGGAFNATYYISGQSEICEAAYWENTGKDLIDIKRLGTRGATMINMKHMLDAMSDSKPLDFDKVIATKLLRIMATNVLTGKAKAFDPPQNKGEMLLQLTASAAIPVLASGPITIDGVDYLDAGIAEKIPFETPLHHGYDAILILSTRALASLTPQKTKIIRHKVIGNGLGKFNAELSKLALEDPYESAYKRRRISKMTDTPSESPYAFLITPDEDTKLIGQFELQPKVIKAGARSGYKAVEAIIT